MYDYGGDFRWRLPMTTSSGLNKGWLIHDSSRGTPFRRSRPDLSSLHVLGRVLVCSNTINTLHSSLLGFHNREITGRSSWRKDKLIVQSLNNDEPPRVVPALARLQPLAVGRNRRASSPVVSEVYSSTWPEPRNMDPHHSCPYSSSKHEALTTNRLPIVLHFLTQYRANTRLGHVHRVAKYTPQLLRCDRRCLCYICLGGPL